MSASSQTQKLPDHSDGTSGDGIFELAPVALWIEDWSAVKALLEQWRLDSADALRAFLRADIARAKACANVMRVIKVNARTLTMYAASSHEQLLDNLGQVFRDDMLDKLVDELAEIWDGATYVVSNGVNYALDGRRLDVQVKARILPGHEANWSRVLVCTEDVTKRENARLNALRSEAYASGLFEHSPVSLWVEDFSSVRKLLDEVRAIGIVDFRVFTDVHPEFVVRCMSEIRVIDVNRHTLQLYGAPDKRTLLENLDAIFRDAMLDPFREQLMDLWNGKLFQQREVINYALDGAALYLHMQFSVLPGREGDWAQVQIAMTDITARKKAENYLEFLGKNDVLTKLHNRSFYCDELSRLDRKGPFPVTILVIDINDLKHVNDTLGHAAGDDLLRRTGEVLNKAVDKPNTAARMGGDEFVVLMPGADENAGQAMMASIVEIIAVNNQFYSGHALSVAIGVATSRATDRLDDVVKRADAMMYKFKNARYSGGRVNL